MVTVNYSALNLVCDLVAGRPESRLRERAVERVNDSDVWTDASLRLNMVSL